MNIYRNSITKQERSSPRNYLRRYSSFHNWKEALCARRSICDNIQEQDVYFRRRPSPDGIQRPLFLRFVEGREEPDALSPMMIGHLGYNGHSQMTSLINIINLSQSMKWLQIITSFLKKMKGALKLTRIAQASLAISIVLLCRKMFKLNIQTSA